LGWTRVCKSIVVGVNMGGVVIWIGRVAITEERNNGAMRLLPSPSWKERIHK
jgi:hypothetical protein